jgi:hypothetical protein
MVTSKQTDMYLRYIDSMSTSIHYQKSMHSSTNRTMSL